MSVLYFHLLIRVDVFKTALFGVTLNQCIVGHLQQMINLHNQGTDEFT